uniref:Isoepoxyedon dehydrogenase n=1 Tax=Ganoderma boninense TaxID=34458 RepID=A0A5K1JTY4_9APHY
MTASTYKNLSIATRVAAIFVDGLVVVLTWMKTHRVYVLTRKLVFGTNYSTLLLRDGTLYFLCVTASCVYGCGPTVLMLPPRNDRAVVILNVIAIAYVTRIGSNLLNDIIVTLTSILMSRFLLNLRDERAQYEMESATRASSMEVSSFALSTLKFQSSASHSMAGSMIDDDDDDDNPERDPEAQFDEKDGRFRRRDTLGSTRSSDSSEELFVAREHGAVLRAIWYERRP